MNSDFLAGLGGFIAGAACVWMGAYAYIGKGAPSFFGRASETTGGLFGKAVVVFLLPAGLGMILLGSAFMIGKNAVTENMLVSSLAFFAAALVLLLVHPKWVQPKWMRNDRSKHEHRTSPPRSR